MSLLAFPIRRHQFMLVIFTFLVALGWTAWEKIPRGEDPYFPISAFIVTAIYPGGDPVDLERSVGKPIEDRLSELDDLKSIDTFSNDNVAVVAVEFEAYVDVEKKYDEVVREINALRPELPSAISEVIIRKINPGLVNIVQMALVSEDAPYAELESYARALKDELKNTPGIRTAEIWAFPQRELRVELNLKRMNELRIDASRVIQALQSENANIPGGTIDAGSQSFTVKTSGYFETLEQVRDTVITGGDGRIVRVRDVAEVRWDEGQHNYLARFNGKRAVFITANQKDGFNIFETRAALEKRVQRFVQTLPPRIQLERGFEQAQNVATRLNRLGFDFVLAVSLVLLTLSPLGLRAAGVVAIAIPLSLAMGLCALYFLGYSLNQLSIAGFVVALGLLVDDSIVVVENIERHLRMGMERVDAALRATQQISVAIMGCTATLIFAFLPLIALPGNAGKFIRVLPLTIVVTVIASLIVALAIIPFLSSRILKPSKTAHGNWLLQKLTGGIHRFYKPILERALARPKTTLLLAGVMFLASLAIIPVIGFSLFPKADTPQFLITIETAEGSSLKETDRALKFVEQELSQMPEVKSYLSNLGSGNPKVFYNIIPRNPYSNLAEVFVQLHRFEPGVTPKRIDELRGKLGDFPNAHILIREFENGPPIDAPIAIRVLGQDLETLQRMAAKVTKLMQETPGTRDIDNPVAVERTDLKLRIDTIKAGLLGVRTVEIDRAVRLAVAGLDAGNFNADDGEVYPIVVRAPLNGRPSMQSLEQVMVPTLAGAQLPLSQLATLEFVRSPTQIQRWQRNRMVMITAYTQSGFNTDRVTREILAKLEAVEWPRGYRYNAAGEVESREESFQGLGAAALVAVFGIFAVLVLEFGSFKSTLIVLTVVPLGVVGGLIALLLTGFNLSFMALIGFIALIGIEIKNSILLVDFTNQLRSTGMALDEAIAEAGEVRFLPILLTSLTAIGGLLPLALQNIGMYSPMAWVIIGGLISSTFLARLVTPVMYKLLPPEIEVVPAPATIAPRREPA